MSLAAGRSLLSSPRAAAYQISLGTLTGGGEAFGEADSVNFFGNGNSDKRGSNWSPHSTHMEVSLRLPVNCRKIF